MTADYVATQVGWRLRGRDQKLVSSGVCALRRSLIESFTLLLLSHYHWTFQHCGAEIMLEFLPQIPIAQLEMI